MDGHALKARQTQLDGVVAELASERANALGKANEKLVSAIAALESGEKEKREVRLNAVANALWELVVHRECCGLTGNARELARKYGVPAEALTRVGSHSPPCPDRDR